MKKILTSMLLAIAVFSMAAMPTNNKTEKKSRNAATATTAKADHKDGKNEQAKCNLSEEQKKDKRAKALMNRKNEIWNSSNGGGRVSYH